MSRENSPGRAKTTVISKSEQGPAPTESNRNPTEKRRQRTKSAVIVSAMITAEKKKGFSAVMIAEMSNHKIILKRGI